MARVVRLTEQELSGLLKGILSMVMGDKGNTNQQTSGEEKSIKPTTPITSNKIVGSGWKSCKAWKSKGGASGWGDKIKVDKGQSQFKVTYKGPSSGLSIAHAANGGDTIHQLYNVLICEINPFLGQGKMKPKIDSIKTEGGKNGKDSTISITVPIERSDETYQLDRRGGWGHDPGASKMTGKCNDIKSKGGKCFGPVKNILQAPFGKITEYFVTHTI
jgi:hypothetical protein